MYFNYLIAELAVINRKPSEGDSRTVDVQRLIDEVYPAIKIWPVCENTVARALLELGVQGPVDIRLDELTETFGHCDNLAPFFAKLKRAQQQ